MNCYYELLTLKFNSNLSVTSFYGTLLLLQPDVNLKCIVRGIAKNHKPKGGT
jgi:hypothetical protein